MINTDFESRRAKLVLIGSATVGKTSVAMRLSRDSFFPETEPTIGATFIDKVIPLGNFNIKMQVWDTGGSEKYKSLIPVYFRNADAALIFYDITSQKSFEEVLSWLSDVRDKGPDKIVVGLIGNKADLESRREVSREKGEELAKQKELLLFKETSALTGEGVHDVFMEMAKIIMENRKQTNSSNGLIAPQKSEKKGCC
jgi:Ras-related protein Rab-5C